MKAFTSLSSIWSSNANILGFDKYLGNFNIHGVLTLKQMHLEFKRLSNIPEPLTMTLISGDESLYKSTEQRCFIVYSMN